MVIILPDLGWLSIAIACGYHDYQQMTKDYLEFAEALPAKWFELDGPHQRHTLANANLAIIQRCRTYRLQATVSHSTPTLSLLCIISP